MDKGLVSIVVPLYNCEDRILRCVRSLLNQTYKNIEVIVINDGSTDNSLKVLQEGISDSRLKVFTQDNHGVSYTRNRGIEIALSNETDGWITFVDSDDYINPNTIYDCLDYDDLDSVELVHYGFRRTNENDVEKQNFCDNDEFIINKFEALQNFLKGRLGHKYVKGNWVTHITSALFRKRIINSENLRFDTTISMGEDGMFSLRYLDFVNTVRMLNKSYYTWCDRPGSLSSANGERIVSRLVKECSIIWPMMLDRIFPYDHELDFSYAEWIVSYYGFILNYSAKVNLTYSGVKKYYSMIFGQKKELQYVYNQKFNSIHEKISRLMLKSKSTFISYVVVKLMRIANGYGREKK